MADLKTKVEIEITKTGDGSAQATKAIREVTAEAEKSSTAFSTLSKAVVGYFSARAIFSFAKDTIKAFGEAEESVNRLAGTLRARGQFTEEYSKHLQGLSNSLKAVSVHGDEAILNASSTLISFGATRNQIDELTKSTLDLAAGLRIDLTTAANMIGKALSGQTAAFSRWGFQVDETAEDAEKLEQVLRQIEQRFGGLAAGETQTFTGQIKQLAEAFGDLKEQLGGLVVPIVKPAVSGLADAVKGINAQIDRTKINDGYRNVTAAESLMQARHLEDLLKADLKVEKSLERQKELRDAIRKLIIAQKELSPEAASEIHAAQKHRQAREDANAAAAALLNPKETPSAPEVPLAPLATPQQMKALSDLATLRQQLTIQALEGDAKERASIEATFQARQASIEKLADTGKIDDEARHRMIVANERVRDSELRIVEARSIERQQAEEMESFREATEARREANDAKELARKHAMHEQLETFERELELAAITSSETRIQHAQTEFQKRIEFYRELLKQGTITESELAKLTRDSNFQFQRAQAESAKANQALSKQMVDGFKAVGVSIEQNFAAGLARATVQGISNFKDLGKAFKQFAADFLRQVAEMILQTIILLTLKAALRAFGFGFATGGVSTAANGGMFPRKMASGGVEGAFDIDQATFFPRHNVIAGEAGRETLAVLSRPRGENFAGVPAVSGMAAGKEVSLVGRSGLAALAGGAGGEVMIKVDFAPGLRGEIINDAVGVAVVRVDQRLNEDSMTSRSVRQLAKT